jgi:hypothetical protein
MSEVLEINVATEEVIRRDYTADELADREARLIKFEQMEAAAQAKAAAKAAVLAKLGLTADEAAALLG